MKLSEINKINLKVVILCRTEDNPIMWEKLPSGHWKTDDVQKLTAEDMVADDWRILTPDGSGCDYKDAPHPKVVAVTA